MRVRLSRMLPVKATQYLERGRLQRKIFFSAAPHLRNIEPALEAARPVTLLQPRRGRLLVSTSRRKRKTGKRVAQRRSLVETVSPV